MLGTWAVDCSIIFTICDWVDQKDKNVSINAINTILQHCATNFIQNQIAKASL